MKLRKILLPTDFSDCATAALDHALVLAGEHDAELHLLHVAVLHEDDPFHATYDVPDTEVLLSRIEEASSERIQELLAARPREPIAIRQCLRRGLAPAPAILDYASVEGIDLIVMGAHGRRGLRRLLLGSVAEEVVRLAPCPVLTMRRHDGATEVKPFRTILVPLDFSEPSRFALAEAGALAAEGGGELRILHVIEPPMDLQIYAPLHDRTVSFAYPELAPRVRERLETIVAEQLGDAVRASVEVVQGHAAPKIVEQAEGIAADLIVIATHGLTGLYRFFLGSVAERVVRSSGVPVLTVKVPKDRRRDAENAA